ncbi:hypothetical protein BDK51DRAFT_37821 [Blyttiomyces helicus]|uniref:Uncharacterized protein n=1 Tax=Blyttiomyces helicus TaxID=388810 RepID=A0A4P9W2M6_9FUNG|nr:hypothetical protein BDK51DRAFT_37821 [Blyttiomyces helicus]|eukprot:RKO84326.1 hypothetical protein BDK51DRAFT_37821 [Blyttiomyces helicus]
MPRHARETDESVSNTALSQGTSRRFNQKPQGAPSVFSRLGPPINTAQSNLPYSEGPARGTSNRGKQMPEATSSLMSRVGPPAGNAQSYLAPQRASPYTQTGASALAAETPFSRPGFSRASSVNHEANMQPLGSEGSTGSSPDRVDDSASREIAPAPLRTRAAALAIGACPSLQADRFRWIR